MRTILLPFILLSFAAVASAQNQRKFLYSEGDTTYTMKHYVFMMLDSGGVKSKDSTDAAKYQELHMAHLNK